MADYKFYIQAVDKNGNPLKIKESDVPIKDLETDFNEKDSNKTETGLLKYIQCVGLDAIGENRVYTEEYSESENLRVYIPQEQTYKPTEITLTLCFIGTSRQKVYDSFNNYITQGFHKYWDTARNKEFVFFIEDGISVKEESSKGNIPYMIVDYKLKNLSGKTKNRQ